MRKHSCSLCCTWARTGWGDADTPGVALSLRTEDGCKTFTAKTPLCKRDRPMAAGRSLQPSLPRTERQKKVLLGWIEREEHSQHILLCEKGWQLGWAACRNSYFKCFVTVRAFGELDHAYTGMKNIFYTPPNLWMNTSSLFSAAHTAGRKGSGEILQGILDQPGGSRWEAARNSMAKELLVLTWLQSFSADHKVP